MENFCELLSEARKYKLGLVFQTQYTALLQQEGGNGSSLLSAIFGNVGTIMVFRVGQEDAVRLSPVLYPNFSAADIIGLSNFHGYTRFQPGGDCTPQLPNSKRQDKVGQANRRKKCVRLPSSSTEMTQHLLTQGLWSGVQPTNSRPNLRKMIRKTETARMKLRENALINSFRIRKDPAHHDAEAASSLRGLSNRKYGTDIKIIDDRILKRRSFWRK